MSRVNASETTAKYLKQLGTATPEQVVEAAAADGIKISGMAVYNYFKGAQDVTHVMVGRKKHYHIKGFDVDVKGLQATPRKERKSGEFKIPKKKYPTLSCILSDGSIEEVPVDEIDADEGIGTKGIPYLLYLVERDIKVKLIKVADRKIAQGGF